MIIIRCRTPTSGSKTQNGRFLSESALHVKKVCYNFLCVNTVGDKVVRHSLVYLSIRARHPPLRENLAETDILLQKRRFPINNARSASSVTSSE